MLNKKTKRKLAEVEKCVNKAMKWARADRVRHQISTFLSQFNPEVRAHLEGEFFKKLDERRQQRQHGER